MPVEFPGKEIPLHAYTVGISDIQKIYKRLLEQVSLQGDREINALIKPDELDQDEWANKIENNRIRAFRITVTIQGADGSIINGDDVSVFTSPNLPDVIKCIYMTNTVAYHGVANQDPVNSFSLLLDFSKPSLLDGNNVIIGPTPNNSNLRIYGDSESWVATIHAAVDGVLKNRGNYRAFIHRNHIYDLGVVTLGIPFAFYIEFQMLEVIESKFNELHAVFVAGIYVYVFFASLWGFRLLFSYTKWAFPSLQLTSATDSASKHRGFWYVVVTGIVINTILTFFDRGIFP